MGGSFCRLTDIIFIGSLPGRLAYLEVEGAGGNKELWLELCEQAANEQDPDRLLAVIREIDAALELKIRRLKQSGPQLALHASGLPRCFLCGKPAPLDTSETDENG